MNPIAVSYASRRPFSKIGFFLLFAALSAIVMPESCFGDEGEPAGAWQVEILSPSHGSMVKHGEVLYLKARPMDDFFHPDTIYWQYATPEGFCYDSAGFQNPRPTGCDGFDIQNAYYNQGFYETYSSYFPSRTSPGIQIQVRAVCYAAGQLKSISEPVTVHVVEEIHGPDLAVSDFEIEVLMPGEKDLHGNTYAKKQYYFVWTVKNMGDQIAVTSKINVGCWVIGGSAGCNAYTKDVKQLWPQPDQVSGAQKFWNDPPFPEPEGPVTLRLRAEVDPDKIISETDETNNTRMKDVSFPLKLAVAPQDAKRLIKDELKIKPGAQVMKDLGFPFIQSLKPGEVFNTPARFTLKTKHHPAHRVLYVLKKKTGNQYREIRRSQNPHFTIIQPGKYCVSPVYDLKGARSGECIEFEVKAGGLLKKKTDRREADQAVDEKVLKKEKSPSLIKRETGSRMDEKTLKQPQTLKGPGKALISPAPDRSQ